jgi:hypothetical protein
MFRLGCYGCIFHRTGNSDQSCQNFGILGRGLKPLSPWYATVRVEFDAEQDVGKRKSLTQ